MDLSKFFETSSQIQKINTKLEWQQTFFKLGSKQIHNLSKGTCWEKFFSCVKLSEISFFFFLWEELSEIFFFYLSLLKKKNPRRELEKFWSWVSWYETNLKQ